jgi:hypothetical protein
VWNSGQIVSGNSVAMSSDVGPGSGWQYTAAFVALALGLLGAWHTTAGESPSQRVGVALLWVSFSFFAFKETFIRWDGPHAPIFFEAVLAGFLAFRWRPGHRWTGLVGLAVLLVFSLSAQGRRSPTTCIRAPASAPRLTKSGPSSALPGVSRSRRRGER